MNATAAPMTAVESQPSQRSRPVTGTSPITSARDAISIVSTMIGADATPLITALQNSALIGSSGEKFTAAPTSVAMAMVA